MNRELDVFRMAYKRGRKKVTLTPSEYKILYALSFGSNKLSDFSRLLGIREATIKTHISNLRDKLVRVNEKKLLNFKEGVYCSEHAIALVNPILKRGRECKK